MNPRHLTLLALASLLIASGADIKTVQANVRHFATKQRESMTDFEIETAPGVFLGQKHVPVQATGAYVPGGRYPLTASAHMTIITAKVAGLNCRIYEVGISYAGRTYAEGKKIGWRDGVRAIWCILKYR